MCVTQQVEICALSTDYEIPDRFVGEKKKTRKKLFNSSAAITAATVCRSSVFSSSSCNRGLYSFSRSLQVFQALFLVEKRTGRR